MISETEHFVLKHQVPCPCGYIFYFNIKYENNGSSWYMGLGATIIISAKICDK